jgi:hypothetical protein
MRAISVRGGQPAFNIVESQWAHLKRNSYISYDMPELVLGRSIIKGIEQVNDFGGTMIIRIKDAAVIYFDFINREWVYLP